MQIEKRERRQTRSDNALEALLLQLSHVRDEAGLSALVLASHDGLTIAHVGDEELCSELAALAPLLSRGQYVQNDVQIAQPFLCVRAVEFEGTPLYLASCGEECAAGAPAEMDRWLAEATQGVTRILAA
jgi:hypothetical protein